MEKELYNRHLEIVRQYLFIDNNMIELSKELAQFSEQYAEEKIKELQSALIKTRLDLLEQKHHYDVLQSRLNVAIEALEEIIVNVANDGGYGYGAQNIAEKTLSKLKTKTDEK